MQNHLGMKKYKTKKAYLLIEIVLVLIIVSVLVFTSRVNIKKDYLSLAVDRILFDIKYCQHLALIDSSFDIDDGNHFKKYWQVKFNKRVDNQVVWAYTIFKDLNYDGNINISDTIAKNYLNKTKLLSGGQSGVITLDDKRRTKTMTLKESFGIDDIKFSKSCSRYGSTKVIFNNNSKPYYGYSYDDNRNDKYTDIYAIEDTCKITLIKENRNKSICIEPNTGFSYICD
jgi:hypothetical protein